MGFLTVLGLIIHLIMFQTSIDNGFSQATSIISVDGLNINSLTSSGYENLTDNDHHTMMFENFDNKLVNAYTNTQFCAYVNNTGDGSNIIIFVDDTQTISNNIYVISTFEGFVCSNINASHARNGKNLGLRCEDCTNSNKLQLPEFSGTQTVEVEINKTNNLVYTAQLQDPHAYYVKANHQPTQLIETNHNLFLLFLSVFIMAYTMRFLIRYVKEGIDF